MGQALKQHRCALSDQVATLAPDSNNLCALIMIVALVLPRNRSAVKGTSHLSPAKPWTCIGLDAFVAEARPFLWCLNRGAALLSPLQTQTLRLGINRPGDLDAAGRR
jgi:hypothetical protein